MPSPNQDRTLQGPLTVLVCNGCPKRVMTPTGTQWVSYCQALGHMYLSTKDFRHELVVTPIECPGLPPRYVPGDTADAR
jgi:hypothetical protein